MMTNLRERYFPTIEEEEAEDEARQQAAAIERGRLIAFLSCEYQQEFKKWLDNEARRQHPEPGPHENMLYQCGKRDGLQMVLDRLDLLARSCRET